MPNYIEYQQSISKELMSIKDRVRNFIDNHHWGEDGRYKEIILSHVLRQHLPKGVSVGTGFVVNNDNIWQPVSVAASEQESSSWSRWMMLAISSWTTQFMMRLRQVSIMWFLSSARISRKSSKRLLVIALPPFALLMISLWTTLSRISTMTLGSDPIKKKNISKEFINKTGGAVGFLRCSNNHISLCGV